jgi:hypothetical protein
MLTLFASVMREVVRAVAPLIASALVLCLLLAEPSAARLAQFAGGSILVILGMVLLLAGFRLAILPMGRYIGAELPRKGTLAPILAVAFAMGFATTVAEPDVLVLASQVRAVAGAEIGGQRLVYIIAAGVGLFAALALLRIVRGFRMTTLLAAAYGAMLLLTFLAPTDLVPLAYDAGSVTTGVLTAPILLALALGFTSVLAGRSTVADGFGLLGLASAGPIIVVLLIALAQS